MLRARSPLLHFNPPPLPPPALPARVIWGAYTGAVQSYLTFSIKMLTFFWLDISLYFFPNVAQKWKTCSRLPELQKALLLTPEVL